MRSAVLLQSTRVMTDGQTDGIGVACTALSIASRGKNWLWAYKTGNISETVR